MAFPDDLANVVAFKIHPAIGVARLANNDDYYEFFDYEEKRKAGQAQSLTYMTKRNGKHWIMRQAVQFKIFAYQSDGSELGELTEKIANQLGLSATWTASCKKCRACNPRPRHCSHSQKSARTTPCARLKPPSSSVWAGRHN